jgi:hypothetical protein
VLLCDSLVQILRQLHEGLDQAGLNFMGVDDTVLTGVLHALPSNVVPFTRFCGSAQCRTRNIRKISPAEFQCNVCG